MLTSVAIHQGNIPNEGLYCWYDIGNPASYLGAGAGTTVFDLSGNNVTASIAGGAIYRSSYGGCIELDGVDDTFSYTGGLSASFSVVTVVTSGTDANPNLAWTNDDGAFPGFRPATNGFVWAVQSGVPSYIVPILWAGASAATIGALRQAPSGYTGWDLFENVYSFTTNGSNRHRSYLNNIVMATDTATRNRGDSAVGTIFVGRDPVLTRFATGRIVAYLHYNRELSTDEVYQISQYYTNRVGTK